MRTKALLCAVALTAGIGLSIAQSNVTNVNVTLIGGGGTFHLIANPLNNTNNDITNLFRLASDSDQIYRWNSVKQDLDGGGEVIQYSALFGWSSHFILQPGEAVFYSFNAGPNIRTIQFVGEVIQGPYTNPIPFGTIAVRGNGLYNAYGGIIPVAGSFTNALIGLTPADGDQVLFWNPTIQDFDITAPTYSAFSQTWTPSTTVLKPGIGFFYMRAGPDQAQWIRNTTVP